MALVTHDPGGLIAGDFPVQHRAVTIATGAAHVRGEVLGRVTASDKYILSASAAADGSQTPVAVLAEDVDASAGDKIAPVYFTGEFAADQLIFGAAHTADTVDASWRQTGKPLFVRKRA